MTYDVLCINTMYILIDVVLKMSVHISWLQTGLFILVATHTSHFVYC